MKQKILKEKTKKNHKTTLKYLNVSDERRYFRLRYGKKGKLNSRFYFYHSKSQSKEPQQIQDDSLDIIFGKSFGRRLKEGTD